MTVRARSADSRTGGALEVGLVGAAMAVLSAVSVAQAAALPIQEGRMVSYTVGKDVIKGYLSRPVADNAYPGVVVVHEWWGLNDQIKGVADRLAQEGYLALVPDLYRGKVPTDAGYAHDMMRGLNQNWAVGAIQGAAACLRDIDGKERRRTAGQKMPIGTLGFCMGGGLTLAAALKDADIQAAVMFYGSVETDVKALQPLAVPLLAIFGNEDRGIPLDQIKAFEAALKEAGKKATVLVYPGVGHAFFNEERPGYDSDVALDAWERTKMFFHDTLRGPALGARPILPKPAEPPPKTDEP